MMKKLDAIIIAIKVLKGDTVNKNSQKEAIYVLSRFAESLQREEERDKSRQYKRQEEKRKLENKTIKSDLVTVLLDENDYISAKQLKEKVAKKYPDITVVKINSLLKTIPEIVSIINEQGVNKFKINY